MLSYGNPLYETILKLIKRDEINHLKKYTLLYTYTIHDDFNN